MNPLAAVLVLLGAALAVVAALGILRFSTPYARFHAAGKASPVAFLLCAAGAGVELGGAAAARLLIAALAFALTLPVGVHLLFRATYRTADNSHLCRDDMG